MTGNTRWAPPSPRELLVTVRDWIRDHPAQHVQEIWLGSAAGVSGRRLGELRDGECGTAGCVAGWTAVFGGDPDAVISEDAADVRKDGVTLTIDQLARELLDLTPYQADYLFSGGRTRDEVLEYLDELIYDPYTDAPQGWDEEPYDDDEEQDEV